MRWDEGSLRGTTRLKTQSVFTFPCLITEATVGDWPMTDKGGHASPTPPPFQQMSGSLIGEGNKALFLHAFPVETAVL